MNINLFVHFVVGLLVVISPLSIILKIFRTLSFKIFQRNAEKNNISVIPLAIPMLFGSGLISVLTIYIEGVRGLWLVA